MHRFSTALFAASALAAISVHAANAADIPVRAPVARAPASAPYNWTGLYVGANVGYAWTTLDGTLSLAGRSNSGSTKLNGVIGGGQIGYNWHTSSNIVLGIEADIQASGQKETESGSYLGYTYTGTYKVKYFGTVRGRIGYAMDRWMPYITGGLGYGEASANATLAGLRTFNVNPDHALWTVGGGVETAIAGNWTAKVEYLYLSTDVTHNFSTHEGTLTVTDTVKTNVVRVGLNYRF